MEPEANARFIYKDPWQNRYLLSIAEAEAQIDLTDATVLDLRIEYEEGREDDNDALDGLDDQDDTLEGHLGLFHRFGDLSVGAVFQPELIDKGKGHSSTPFTDKAMRLKHRQLSNKSMRRQLILLLFGFTALLSLLFSAVVLIVYFRVEDNIFAGQLEKVLHSYSADPAAFVSAPRTLEGHILHVGPLQALPQDLQPLIENKGAGYHEIELKDREFHWLAQPQPPGEQLFYVVAQIDEDETHETRLQIALLVGMVATLASAIFLGRLIARRTVSPVERLSDRSFQIQYRNGP